MKRKDLIDKEKLEKLISEFGNINLVVQNSDCSINTIRHYIKKYKLSVPKGFYKKMEARKKRAPMSAEHRQKLSQRFSGNGNPFFGRKHTDATREKMSKNHADVSGDKNPFRKACESNPAVREKLSEDKVKYWANLTTEERYAITNKNVYEDISKHQWHNIVNNAKGRGLDFQITLEYIWNIWIKQDGRCALSGIELNLKSIYEITASLDRKNSDLGYIEGNVQWVHKDINIMKGRLTDEEFIQICNRVSEHARPSDGRGVDRVQ